MLKWFTSIAISELIKSVQQLNDNIELYAKKQNARNSFYNLLLISIREMHYYLLSASNLINRPDDVEKQLKNAKKYVRQTMLFLDLYLNAYNKTDQIITEIEQLMVTIKKDMDDLLD